MDISIARIYRLETDGAMKAFVDVIIDNALIIKAFRIIEGKNGLFVSYPKDQGKDKRWYDIVRPITKEAQEQLSKALIDAYVNQ
jgi:stage V sporulation protein G